MSFPRAPRVRLVLKVLGTLFLALVAASVCVWLNTPIPWMLGPLLVTAVVSLAGVPTASWVPLRNGGQWVIGTVLGLYFTPQVGALVAGLWWAILLAIAWALLLGWGFGRWLQRVHGPHLIRTLGGAPAGASGMSPASLRATTYFAGAIGGASEMTLLAERAGARTDLVASAHSLRVLLVTICLPFGMVFWGVSGLDLAPPAVRDVHPAGLALLGALTLIGALLAQRLGRANPWFMGALLVTMAITLSGQVLSAVPTLVTNAAQLAIGVSLGVRFTPAFLHTAPRWLGSVALASVLMMAISALFGFVLSRLIGQHPATLILGTSPGGIAEMAITAKVLQLGVPVVTAFQVCRLVAVLVLAEPLYRWWSRRTPL